MKVPFLFILKNRGTVIPLSFFSLCIVVLPVFFIFSGPVKSLIRIMYNCVACIIPWIVLLLSQDSWFQPLVFPEWSLMKGRKKKSEITMMFWINISDNLPPIMVCVKCHHAMLKWRMVDSWWRGSLQIVGWQTLRLCFACVISIVSHHLVCFTLMCCTFNSCVTW